MSEVVPVGHTAWSSYGTGAYRPAEAHMNVVGRPQRATDRTPVVFCHGFSLSITVTADHRTPAWMDDFRAIAGSTYPIVAADLGGGSTWGNPDSIDAVDDLLAWAAESSPPAPGVDTSKVALFGESMGGLLALNWAWRNANRVRAMVLRAPVVAMEAFRVRNAATFGGAMDGAYGGSISESDYNDHDPMRNLALIRPFGDRIQIWYGEDDEFIPPSEIQAFAELVGATAIELPGVDHAGVVNTPVDRPAMWLIRNIRERRRAVVDWQSKDWGRFDQHAVTLPSAPDNNVNALDTVVAPGGRRGRFIRRSGTEGNERFGFLLRELLLPDMRIKTTWWQDNGGPETGQQGNIVRGVVENGTYSLYIAWVNVFFGIPWIVNRGVWTGTVGANDLTLLGVENSTIPGIRLAAGGDVLASSRTDGVVTLVVEAADLPHFRTGLINVELPGIANYDGVATISGPNHISYDQAGPDVISGGSGSWADLGAAFPYEAETEVRGNPATMRSRFWIPGDEPPDWDDTDWAFTWQDTGGWGPTGYGHPGIMVGHVGLFSPNAPNVQVEFGTVYADER